MRLPHRTAEPETVFAHLGPTNSGKTHDALRFLVEKAGPGNVLIGTDCSFPSCTPFPMAELKEALGDDAAAIKAVAEVNAYEMFWK